MYRKALDQLYHSIKNGIAKSKIEACCKIMPLNSKKREVDGGNKKMKQLYDEIN